MSTLPDTLKTIIDRRSGELLDLATVDTGRLARFVDDVAALHGELADAEALASAELVARLDKDVTWTQIVRDEETGRVFDVTAPSPDAGTVTYDPDGLERELRALVARKTISAAGAAEALQRRLTVEVDVPLDADLDALAAVILDSTEPDIGGVRVDIRKVTISRKAMLGGVKKIAKVGGTGAALGRAKRFTPDGVRRARVKLKSAAS